MTHESTLADMETLDLPNFNKGIKMELSHVIFINRQYSNGWLKKCSCGELFTGKGISTENDNKTPMHLIMVKEPKKVVLI